MKKKNQYENGKDKSQSESDSGQMILLAGFLLAIMLVSLAVVVGGAFFSQSAVEDQSVSQLTSQVADQIQTAKDVGLTNVVSGNEDAVRTKAKNETEVCQNLLNLTKDEVTEQIELSENELVLGIELIGNCQGNFSSANTSYTAGQFNDGPLPGVGINDSSTQDYTCKELRCANYTDFNNHEGAFNDEVIEVVQNDSDAGGTGNVPADYNQSNNSKYDYTQHKITALENVNGIKLSALPNGVTKQEFAKCVSVDIEAQEYNCTQLRSSNWTGFSNATVQKEFKNELIGVVKNETPGSDLPSSPEYNESKNPNAYNYTQHKLTAFSNVASVDLSSDLPSEVTPKEFVSSCVIIEDLSSKTYTCGYLRNETGYSSSVDQFNDELKQVVKNDPNAGAAGRLPDTNQGEPEYNESKNPNAYNYTQHKIQAMQNAAGIDLSKLPSSVTKAQFADCILVEGIGRPPADVVFSIDTTGSMGHPNSPSNVNTPYVQRHKEQYTTSTGRTYTRPNPYNIQCYKEYSETGVEFPGDTDNNIENDDWCAGPQLGSDFNTGVGQVGDFVYDTNANDVAKVVNMPGSPPPGIPTTWTRVTTTGVKTNNPSEYCVDNNGITRNCDTRRVNPGGSLSAGDVVEVDNNGLSTENVDTLPNEPVTAEVLSIEEYNRCVNTGWLGCSENDDVWNVEYSGNTYEVREDALSYFEYKWDGGDIQVKYSSGGSITSVPESDLSYFQYEWYPPDRLYLTQLGARAALDDLVTGQDKVGLVEYSSYIYGNARTVSSLGMLTSGYRADLKEDVDQLRAGGGTDITAGIQQARSELDMNVCDGSASRRADCHIVLLTDGQHNTGYPQPDNYVDSNTDYENVYIHSIALGSGADEPTMKDIANSDGSDSVRPEGVFRASNDPADAKDIFQDIVDEIQNTGNGSVTSEPASGNFSANASATLGTKGVTFTGSRNASTNKLNDTYSVTIGGGAITEVYDLRMNVTEFTGNGTYSIGITGKDGAVERTIWKVTIDNNVSDTFPNTNSSLAPGVPTSASGQPIETQVRFSADPNLDSNYPSVLLNRDPLNSTVNLSDPSSGGYIKIDVPNGELRVVNDTGGVEHDAGSYVRDAYEAIKEEMSGSGVTGKGIAIDAKDTAAAGQANGTFNFDFEPLNGNYSLIGNVNLGPNTCKKKSGHKIVTCASGNNTQSAFSTVQIKTVQFEVRIEGPNGVSTRRVEIKVEEPK